MTFGQKLKYIREEYLKMSQEGVAASIKRSQMAISAIETGKNKEGSVDILRQLVIVHHVNPMYMLLEKSDEPPMLRIERSGYKSALRKLAMYEKLIDKLMEVKRGK